MADRRPNRTLGPGHDAFWRWCDQGELRLPECERCGHLAWPIVDACPRCGGEAFAWRRLGGGGEVVAGCAFHQDYYAGVLPPPYEAMLVALDEGAMFVGNPVGEGWPEDRVGSRVRLAFLDCEDDAGSFRLPVFEHAHTIASASTASP